MLPQEALLLVVGVLDQLQVPTALLGGLAVSVWSDPRFTRDVDLAVAVRTDKDAEALIYELQQRGYRLQSTVEQTAHARLATARMLLPGQSEDGLIVDLLFASSGIEAELCEAAILVDVGAGVLVNVVRIGHLVALKLLASDAVRRPQDGLDLRALRELLSGDELRAAREACRLIAARGYARGRDLEGLLDALVAER